jgi:hypothetical protein
MSRIRIKNLFLACAVLVGLQLVFPLMASADSSVRFAEEISLGEKTAEEEGSGSLDHDLSDAYVASSLDRSFWSSVESDLLQGAFHSGGALLPSTGFHPSAP